MGGAGCCDEKVFGAPCGECSFGEGTLFASEETSSPGQGLGARPTDYDTLGFALTSALSDPAALPFWKVASAAGIYNTGNTDGELDAFVTEGLQWLAAGASAITHSAITLDDEPKPGGDDPPPGKGDGDDDDDWKDEDPPVIKSRSAERCCVKKWEYPKHLHELPPKKIPKDRETELGFFFDAHMVWWSKKERPPCACHCCKFIQLVEEEHSSWAHTATIGKDKPLDVWNTGKPEEDCTWLVPVMDEKGDYAKDEKGEYKFNRVGVAQIRRKDPKAPVPPKDAMEGEEHTFCYGRASRAGHRTSRHHTKTGQPGCRYTMIDKPRQRVPWGRHQIGRIKYHGKVRDTCREVWRRHSILEWLYVYSSDIDGKQKEYAAAFWKWSDGGNEKTRKRIEAKPADDDMKREWKDVKDDKWFDRFHDRLYKKPKGDKNGK